ncbi:MAG: hypothetical protein U5L09_06450 [Bacteroidales bacterium]|nr:hypothetical protein [Bacteroidales bacterium]
MHNQSPSRSFGSWTPAELGDAFRKNLDIFDINKSNFFPFLDRTISGWKFLESHDDFEGKPGGDYFCYVGAHLGRKFIEHKDELKIWIE